ncbi:alpha/beta hydrolase [Corynebacterium phocae]|uniref:Alpha/beta hydrolase n=1 Tax=Corynebacterium phocae TaxID=161895 RepID=A0A1L7D378_9CORY|nr:alpha/beta fold hydrolase [Corynebacterium phocae]APT92560.1 alpha/beta hydrolase [Corynebacterium phocae]KAA8725161.1 alpha/beta hydrolase [Corynebacterium phocae]
MQSVNVSVPSSTGSKMAGTIDFPDTTPTAFAIFAHCFAGSRHTPGAARTSKQLTHHGIATLRFDFPGLGQSEGSFAKTSFSQNVSDIKAAAAWLTENYHAPQLLIGHSLGGAAALAAGSTISSLRGVATIGAPFDPAHSVLHYADKIGEVDEAGQVEVTLGGRTLTISRFFLEDLADTDPVVYLRKLKKPLMILHSPVDTTVGVDNAQNIFRMTRYPKSLVALDKADHLLTKQGAAARAADLIGSWSDEFIVPDFAPEDVGPDAVVARTAIGTNFGVVARTHNRNISADRTRAEGGKDQGVTPEGLLMSAIATASAQAVKAKARELKVRLADAAFERSVELLPAAGTDLDHVVRQQLLLAAQHSPLDSVLGRATITEVEA